METTEKSRADRGVTDSDMPAKRPDVRSGMAAWQAQLLAIGATSGVIIVLVVLFATLTGTL